MATHLLKFGDLDLTEYVADIQFSKDGSIFSQAIQGRHGLLVTSPPTRAPLAIRGIGTLTAATPTALKNLLRTWNYEMGLDRQNLYAVHDDRFYKAYKRKLEISWNPGMAGLEIGWVIEWACDDPFIYVDDGFGGDALDTTAFSLAGGDPNPKSFTVTNTGNQLAFVVVSFTAGVDNSLPHTLRNTTNGDSYTYTGTLAVSDVAELDFRNFTIRKNGVNDLNSWNGGIIAVEPGVNNFEVEGRLGSGVVQSIVKI